jgi:hypothetical protein
MHDMDLQQPLTPEGDVENSVLDATASPRPENSFEQ